MNLTHLILFFFRTSFGTTWTPIVKSTSTWTATTKPATTWTPN